jgi:uncharacterized protein VirK/YbjX
MEMLIKPLRRYLYYDLSSLGRTRLVKGHYRFLARAFSRSLVTTLFDRQGLEVATLGGRKGSRFALELRPAATTLTDREGELVVSIRAKDQDVALSRLSFLFAEREGAMALLIGGLQGPPLGNKRQIVEATRLLHGVRPKDATLLAARALAAELELRVRAVSDRKRLYHYKYKRSIVRNFSDHDDYWRERGASQANDEDFVFAPLDPVGERESPREEVKRAIVGRVRAFVDANRRRPGAPTELGPEPARPADGAIRGAPAKTPLVALAKP